MVHISGNVVIRHPWLYYIQALFVAYVCYTVKTLIYDAQEPFVNLCHNESPRLSDFSIFCPVSSCIICIIISFIQDWIWKKFLFRKGVQELF